MGVVEYGVAITDLARAIRRNVIGALERMTGLEVVKVNVSINDVHLRSDDDGQEQAPPGPSLIFSLVCFRLPFTSSALPSAWRLLSPVTLPVFRLIRPRSCWAVFLSLFVRLTTATILGVERGPGSSAGHRPAQPGDYPELLAGARRVAGHGVRVA